MISMTNYKLQSTKQAKETYILSWETSTPKGGSDRTNWENVLGNYGYGSLNERGEKLLNFCAVNNLLQTQCSDRERKSTMDMGITTHQTRRPTRLHHG